MLRIGWVTLVNLSLWGACLGVGVALVSRRSRRGPDATTNLGAVACVGLAVLLAVGGAATVVAVPVRAVFGLFIGGGLVLLAVRLWRDRRARPGDETAWWAVVGAAFVVVQLAQAVASFASYFPNACDDLLAYLPMAQRLLDTGQLIEPWSIRRLQNLGGVPFLQSLFVSTSGWSALGVPERLTACTFLAGLFVGRRPGRLTTRLGAVVGILLVPALAVPRLNSSAVLLVVPLVVALLVVTGTVRDALITDDRAGAARWTVAAGLLLAGIASVRLQVLPFPTLVLALGVLTVSAASWPSRTTTLLLGAAASCVGVLGWAVASWQSSGTPLYPLLPGNANVDVAMTRDPDLNGLGDQVARTVELALVGGAGPYVVAILAVLVGGVVLRRWLRDPVLVAVVGGAGVATLLLVAAFLTLASTRDFTRYVFPVPAAVAVFFVLVVLRDTDRPERERSPDDSSTRPRPWLVLPLGLAAAALAWVFSPLSLAYPAATIGLWPGTPDGLTSDGRHVEVDNFIATADERAQYRRALGSLPGDGRVVAAVDRPFLLGYGTADVPSLDFVGAAAPDGRFPVFGTTLAKVRLLRSDGYDHLLATVPEANDCSSPELLEEILEAQVRPGPLLARYSVAWNDSLTEIIDWAPGAVRREGTLVLVDLDEAESELAARQE